MSSPGHDQVALENTSTACPTDISAKMEVIFKEMEGKFRKVQSHQILDLFKGNWEVNEDGSQFISFANPECRDSFYVRQCYLDIYKVIEEKCQEPKSDYRRDQNLILISGSPGVGKSCFGMLLCKLLMQRPKPALVFYQNIHRSGNLYFGWQNELYEVGDTYAYDLIDLLISNGLYSESSEEEDAVEIWSIADSCDPIWRSRVKRVVIKPPGRPSDLPHVRRLNQTVEERWRMNLVVPLYKWDEIQHLRLAKYGDLDTAEAACPLTTLRERFDLWGGFPDTIMDTDKVRQNEKDLEELTLEKATTALRAPTQEEQPCSSGLFRLRNQYHRDGHPPNRMKPSSLRKTYEPGDTRWNFVTDFLERTAWRHFLNQQEPAVIQWIRETRLDISWGGVPWEEEVHHLIGLVGLNQIETLERDTDDLEDDIPPPPSTRFFRELSDIDESASYWRPYEPEYEFLDGYMPDLGVLINLKVNRDGRDPHFPPLERALESNIFNAWRERNPGRPIRLIHILYGDKDWFDEQTWTCLEVTGSSTLIPERTLKERRAWVVSQIEQQTTCINLKDRLKALGVKKPQSKRGKYMVMDEDDE